MSVELILWVDSVVFDAWFLISTALVFWMHTRLVYGLSLIHIWRKWRPAANPPAYSLPLPLQHPAARRDSTPP